MKEIDKSDAEWWQETLARRKDTVYQNACEKMKSSSVKGCQEAIKLFGYIPDWKDAAEKIQACQTKIQEIRAQQKAARLEAERKAKQERLEAEQKRLEAERKAEEERLEAERKAEEERIAAEKAEKKRKKVAITTWIVFLVCVAFIIILKYT